MSWGVRERADAVVMVFLAVLWLPARVIEEGLHALAALPYADVVTVELNPREGTAKTNVHFRDSTPDWAIKLAYAAPEGAAVLSALAVIGWFLVGGDVWFPASTLDWVLLSVLGAQYLAIAIPSAADADQTPTQTEAKQ